MEVLQHNKELMVINPIDSIFIKLSLYYFVKISLINNNLQIF